MVSTLTTYVCKYRYIHMQADNTSQCLMIYHTKQSESVANV